MAKREARHCCIAEQALELSEVREGCDSGVSSLLALACSFHCAQQVP